MTNTEFARAVGCHHTMASRLRNGHRLPSLTMFDKIVHTFGLDIEDALSAFRLGSTAFGAFLRATVFSRGVGQGNATSAKSDVAAPT